MSLIVEMSLGALDKCIDEYEVLEASDTEYPEAKCVDVTHKNAIDYFKEWYYLNGALPEVQDCCIEDINECMEKYEVTPLDKFVDESLDNMDYKEHHKRFFDVGDFICSLMWEGYCVFINQGGNYKELTVSDINKDLVWMYSKYTDEGAKYICETEYNMWIVKEKVE